MYLVDLVDPVDLDNKIAEFTVLVRKTFQSNKIRFDYQRIIFQGKSWSQISQMLTVKLRGMTINPTPQSLTAIFLVLIFEDFPE